MWYQIKSNQPFISSACVTVFTNSPTKNPLLSTRVEPLNENTRMSECTTLPNWRVVCSAEEEWRTDWSSWKQSNDAHQWRGGGGGRRRGRIGGMDIDLATAVWELLGRVIILLCSSLLLCIRDDGDGMASMTSQWVRPQEGVSLVSCAIFVWFVDIPLFTTSLKECYLIRPVLCFFKQLVISVSKNLSFLG